MATDNGSGREAGDPLVIWLYGEPKRGKTGALAALCPEMIWIGVNKAIDLVAQGVYGFKPAIWPEAPETFDDIFRMLDGEAGRILSDYRGWGLDDISHICERSLSIWNANAPLGRSGKPDIWWQYRMLNEATGELVARARHAGVQIVGITSHEREPSYDDDGAFHRGGPEMGTKARAKKMPGWCDMMCRMVLDADSPDPWLKTKLWVAPFDKNWVAADRHDVCWTSTPPNLREILLASAMGYDLPRVPGLEWQDEVAEEVAVGIADASPSDVIKAIAASRSAWLKQDQKHGKWLRQAAQDGIARYCIRARQAAGLFSDEVMAGGSSGKRKPPPPPPKKKKPLTKKPAPPNGGAAITSS